MNALARFEGFMRDIMDRRVVRMLGGTLQPVELAQGIARCMDEQREVSPAGPLAPNVFDVVLNPEDCADLRLGDYQLEQRLRQYAVELARERGFNFAAAPRVRLVADADVERGAYRVEGEVSRPTNDHAHWRAAQRRSSSSESSLHFELTDGVSAPTKLPVDHFPFGIGRAPDGDLVLPDPRVSRHHAVVDRVDGGFQLRDLGSRNGTLVNGQSVAEADLRDGDRVTIGGFEAIVRID